jgi:hypothetical protein
VAFPTVPLAGDGKATAGRGGEGDKDPQVSRQRALELSGGGGCVLAPKKKEVTARLRGKAGGGRGLAEDELQGGQCGEAGGGRGQLQHLSKCCPVDTVTRKLASPRLNVFISRKKGKHGLSRAPPTPSVKPGPKWHIWASVGCRLPSIRQLH